MPHSDTLREVGRIQRGGLGPGEKAEVFLSRGVRLFVTIPDLGWLMLLVLRGSRGAIRLYMSGADSERKLFDIANRAIFISILLQSLALVFFLLRARDGHYPRSMPRVCSDQPGGQPVHSFRAGRRDLRLPAVSAACCGGVEDLERLLPNAESSTASPTKPFALPSRCSP